MKSHRLSIRLNCIPSVSKKGASALDGAVSDTADGMGAFAEGQNGFFQNPELAAVGQKYGKTPAQVILRWLRQSKIVSIPKSVHEEQSVRIMMWTISF